MGEAHNANTAGSGAADAGPNLSLISTQLSWMRSDLSNLRTLLSWVRTSVSMIGFGFTIYNFYSGIFQTTGGERIDDAARNLGLALVGFGTLALIVAIWNYRSINQYLENTSVALEVPRSLKLRWYYSYIVTTVLMIIGLVTFLFMLRVI